MTTTELPSVHPAYTYLVADIQNGKIVGELPVRGCSWGLKLNDVGEMTAVMSWNPTTARMNVKSNTTPGRRIIYLLRNREIVWVGIIWKRRYSRNASGEVSSIEISCETFESYLFRRFQRLTATFTQVDQLDIARWLIAQLDDLPNGALNIEVDQSTGSPRLRDRTFFGYEFKTIGEELSQLANLIDGFDFAVRPYRDENGDLRQRVNFGYPQLGQPAETTNVYFEYPYNISQFSAEEDVTSAATTMYAIGSGEGTEQLQASITSSAHLSIGYPSLELARSYKSVVEPSTLAEHAAVDLIERLPPIKLLNLVVRGDTSPEVGTYFPGDYARVRINDDWFGGQADNYYRITELSVSVPDDSSAEQVTVTFDTGLTEDTEEESDPAAEDTTSA